MKKYFCVLIVLAVFCAGAFAESVIKEMDIKDVSAFVESEDFLNENSYTLQLKNNFKPEEVTVSEIKALSKFMSLNADNKIEGPIEYIYFDGIHSAGVFYEIRQKILNAKGKYVCVDFSVSDYFYDYYDTVYPLPKNTFAGHENLYWVYFGSFARKDVPANLCKDCINLQFAMMWRYGQVDDSAFSGVNKDAKLYDEDGNESPLDLIHQVTVEEYDDWDYLAFTEEDYNNYLAENTYEEDDEDFEDLAEEMDGFINRLYDEAMNQLSFSELLGEDRLQISASNAEQILSDEIFDKTDYYSVAIEFLCNYLLCGEKSDLESSLNERYMSVFDLNDLVFHTSAENKDEDEYIALVIVGIEGNDSTVRDICLLNLEKNEEETWSVSELESFCLLDLMFSTMFSD